MFCPTCHLKLGVSYTHLPETEDDKTWYIKRDRRCKRCKGRITKTREITERYYLSLMPPRQTPEKDA